MSHQVGRHFIGVAQSWVLRSAGAVAEGDTGFLMKELKHLAGASLAAAVLGLGSFQNALADDTQTRIVPVQASTIPSNGDLNPYGVAFVPTGFPGGSLTAGDVLVSNFNAKSNLQGTGTTIVRITPDGKSSLFFQGTPPLGLTTALGVLTNGFVIVGNLPTNKKGKPLQGSLIVTDNKGAQVSGSPFVDATFLDGPWDLTIVDKGSTAIVFVSCVLNGTVTRLGLAVGPTTVTITAKATIASGYKFGLNSAALVVGPTGLAYDPAADVLYVASTADNEIFAVANASTVTSSSGTGTVVFSDNKVLHGPLGLVLAPNGDLISSQGDAINPSKNPAHQSEIVEFTKTGTFVGDFALDSGTGAAFGIAIQSTDTGVVDFAAVNDATNALTVFEFIND